MKDKYLRARLSIREYAQLRSLADAAGLTLSDFLRTRILQEAERLNVELAIGQIKEMLAENQLSESSLDHNQLLVEAVFLLRELIAERSPQTLSIVGRKLDHRFGVGREKL